MSKRQNILILLFTIIVILLAIILVNLFPVEHNGDSNQPKENPWEIINWKTTIVFGFLAATITLFQAIYNTVHKVNELRWSKANLARELVDMVYDDQLAHDALRMLDQSKSEFGEQKFEITIDDVNSALTRPFNDAEKDRYIRYCFDTLFYYIERIEHSIEVRVALLDDISAHFVYYMRYISEQMNLLSPYCKHIGYLKALRFINRSI